MHVDAWRTTYAGFVSDSYLASLSYELSERRWAEILARGVSSTFVAEEEGRIVGFANGGPNRGPEADYTHELYAIYVLKELQGQGLGRGLTLALALPRPWMVWVLRDNPACGFYRKLGGRPAGSKPVTIGDRTLEEIAFGFDAR